MPVSDKPVSNANILSEMREWSGTHESDRGLRDAIKAVTGLDPMKDAWCAAYLNMSLSDLGIQGTGSNLAKSFKTIGRPLDAPVPGAIAVFNRGNPNSIFGHVGVVGSVNLQTGMMTIVGGNQTGARVTESTRPISDAIAFRDASLPGYAYSNSRFDTPSERMAAGRNVSAAREAMIADLTRPDAAVTAPYWDGANNTTPAPASMDLGVTTNPDLSAISLGPGADPYAMGQFTSANAVSETPSTRGIGPSAPDFGGGLEAANAGWAPDAATVANFSGALEGANRGYGGGLPESWAEAPAAPDNFAGSLEQSNAGTGIFDSYSTGGAFGADRMPDNFAGGLEMANAGQIGAFDNAPSTRGFSAPDRAIDVGWGVGAREDRSAPSAPSAPSPMDLGPVDIGGLSSSMPSSRMVDPFAQVPQQAYPLDDVPAFAQAPVTQPSLAPAPAATASISRPSAPSAPGRPSQASPTRTMAPSLPSPISVATPAVSPSFGQGLTQGLTQAQEALSGFGAPNDFLGSMFQEGPTSTVGALNAATGQDWSGTARVAMGGDVMAQPAMLGMGNAYAQATGQPGYRSLFDGLSMPSFGFGSSPAPSGWGTGGLYDPSGAGGLYDAPSQGGFFSGVSDFFGGMFGGGGDSGLGNTPGAGGLY
jgi:uncharacterized protein (TIGR02594 family)